METVVQIGAGAVGRGFLAQLWCDAGYETVFVDADKTPVALINEAGSYRLRLTGENVNDIRTVAPVRAIWVGDGEAVGEALASCAFAATAVGGRNVQSVAQTLITPAANRRVSPLNVLLCENGAEVHSDFVRGLGDAAEAVGVAECVVGRMVPEPHRDVLDLTTEAYAELPFNRDGWLGAIPTVAGLVAVSGDAFPAYELRKRFLHNGGHALLAYHGYRRGYVMLGECAEDTALVAELRGFWTEVSAAFGRSAYKDVPIFAPDALTRFTDDLLTRFRNRDLGDMVARVARDPRRKLAANDRLTGAALFCLAQNIEPVYTIRAIIATLRYESYLSTGVFAEIAGLPTNHPLVDRVETALLL